MAALVRIAPNFRAVFAAHVAFQLMDRRRFLSADDVKRDGLMCIAAEALHFEIEVTSVKGIARRRGRLRRTLKSEHSLVPSVAGKPVSLLPDLRRVFCGSSDRCAVDRFP